MLNDLITNFDYSDILHHPGKVFSPLLAIALAATVLIVVMHLILAVLGGRRRHRANASTSGRSSCTSVPW